MLSQQRIDLTCDIACTGLRRGRTVVEPILDYTRQ